VNAEGQSDSAQRVAPKPKRSLHRILYERAKAAHDEAIRSDGDVPAEEVEFLSRLTKLVEVWDKASAQHPRNRLIIPGVFLLTLLLTSVLLFRRVRTTDIEFSLVSDEIQFVLSETREVTVRRAVTELGVTGQSETDVPAGSAKGELNDLNSSGDTLLSAGSSGQISVPALILPSNTRIQIVKSPIPRQYQISLGGTQFDLQADVMGTVKFVSGGQQFSREFRSPKALLFKSGPEDTSLTLTFLEPPLKYFKGGLPVKNVNLLSFEDIHGPGGPPARIFSPILGGSIFFEELNGAERALRTGEWMRFATSSGELRSVLLKDEHILVQFHGVVSGLRIGDEDHARNEMPTTLEWLKVQRSAALLWGAALYLFTVMMAAVRWFRTEW